jgi:hypothetical protein
MTEEWDKTTGSYFMNNLTRRATKVDPRTGREVPRNAHAAGRERLLTADDYMSGPLSPGRTPRNESPYQSNMSGLSVNTYSPTGGSSFGDATSLASSGPASPISAAEAEMSQVEQATQLKRDYMDQKAKILDPLGEAVSMLARNCGITVEMLNASRSVEPVSAARKAQQVKWLGQLRKYSYDTVEAEKALQSSLRAVEGRQIQGGSYDAVFRAAVPNPPTLAQPIYKYLDLLKQHVEDQQNDLHDLRALRAELPDQPGRGEDAMNIVARLQSSQPMALALLCTLLSKGAGAGEEDIKTELFHELIEALEARIMYKTLTAQLSSALRRDKSSTPTLELANIIGSSDY